MFKLASRCAIGLMLVLGCSSSSPNAADDEMRDENASGAAPCVRPNGEIVIRSNTTICPGTYNLADPEQNGVIRIAASNVRLTLTGVTLRGSGAGYGVVARNVTGASIQSAPNNRANIQGFTAAVLIDGGNKHSVTGCNLSHNHRRPIFNDGSDFLEVWPDWEGQLAADQIGDGIVLLNVTGANLLDNKMTDQQNGIGLFASSNVLVQGNDCSNNQGWGIHLRRSSSNKILNNTADNVNLAASQHCHDTQGDACDTAGILVIKASNDNAVQNNSFRNGGDGIFSAAQQDTIHWGADRNRYIGNDTSFAKHIGVEATFADAVLVQGNTIHNCGRAGVWLGFSRNSTVRANSIVGSGASGIDNESAQNITIVDNEIRGNAESGMFLRKAKNTNQQSTGYTIRGNTIADNADYGIFDQDTHRLSATQNVISGNAKANLRFAMKFETTIIPPIAVNDNQILGSLSSCSNVSAACSCRVYDGNVGACDAAAEGCGFYSCSNQCHPTGTTNCDANCSEFCTGTCRDHDGNPDNCDAAGCAYYFCSNQCHPPGTSSCDAGCGGCGGDCRAFDGDVTSCDAAGCAYYFCSNQCHPPGTSDCDAGCCSASLQPRVAAAPNACPWGVWVDLRRNWWGTTNTAAIAATLCGSTFSFQPILTSPPRGH